MLAEELPAVAAQAGGQPAVLLDRKKRLHELRAPVVVQAGVAPDRLTLEHIATGVGQHGLAERPCLQRHHRQALEVRRHDQELGRRHGVELVGVIEEPEVPDPRMLRHGQDRVADEHERQRARRLTHVGLEVVEELPAALVLVDPPDIHGKRPVDLERLSEPRRLRTRRHVRPDTDHDRWHALVPRERLDHLAFFWRVVHQRAHTPEDRREDREANRGVTLGGRNQNGATTGRADAVIRVVVAITEEEAVVVARRVAPEMADERGRCRTLCVKPGQFVRERMRRVEDVP